MLSLLFMIAAAAAQPSAGQTFYGMARSSDGDSLEVNGRRVRLFGIDAPEFDQTCTRGGASWACGAEAADQLSRLLTGRAALPD